MIIKFDKIIKDVEEFNKYDKTNPYVVAALTIQTICNYENEEMFYKMLSNLLGPKQEINPMFKQKIKDRMIQNNKYEYIGYGYFKNTKCEDNYKLPEILEIEVTDSASQAVEEGYLRVDLTHTGADSKRQIMLRKAKDNNYYLWSDTIINLLVDVKKEDDFWI